MWRRRLLHLALFGVLTYPTFGCVGHCEDSTTMIIVNIVIPLFFIALVVFYLSTKD